MNALTGPLVLAADAEAVVVGDLPASLRKGLMNDPTAVIWNRPRTRLPSIVVDQHGARLLEQFRHPHGIAAAVIAYSEAEGANPHAVLVESFPLLCQAVGRGLLLSPREFARSRVEPVLGPGDRAGRWKVVAPIQVLDDGEVHRVVDARGRVAALKLGRGAAGAARLAREERVLARLDGRVTPRLLDRGRVHRRAFIALEWRTGVSPQLASEPLRDAGITARPHLRRLALAILDAYVTLHRQGVLHGDVHPSNLLVGPRGRVTILDLGQAVTLGAGGRADRLGAAYYLEPEVARVWRNGGRCPPPTSAGEQFAVAALLYQLLTGHPYVDFRLTTKEFLAQVIGETPRPFTALGLPPWPGIESALARALAKAPSDRFPSMAALARDIRRHSAPAPASRPAPRGGGQSRWVEGALARLAGIEPPGVGYPKAISRISVYAGRAGTALALVRVAQRRDDPALLAAADAHCAWAEYLSGSPRGAERRHRPGALLHGSAGVALTRAAIARARADDAELMRAVQWFLAVTRIPVSGFELSSGLAGVLLGASRLVALPGVGPAERRRLRRLQLQSATRLLNAGRRAGGPANSQRWANLGLAHGWAGILYALLAWQATRPGRRPPAALALWLDQLNARGETRDRGRRGPWLERQGRRLLHAGSMPGWCNGGAGFIQLYAAAHRVLGRPVDLARAEAAARDVIAHPPEAFNLCCGAAGAAGALLTLARETAERRWVTRARAMADHAHSRRDPGSGDKAEELGLFRGQDGLMLLLAELDDPGAWSFPLIDGLP